MKFKKYSFISLILIIIFVIAVLSFTFYPKGLFDIVGCSQSDVTEYQITNSKTGESFVVAVGENELMRKLLTLRGFYCGSYTSIYSKPEHPVYHLVLIHKSLNTYDELASFIFNTEGYLYIENGKYKMLNEPTYRSMLQICENIFSKS